MASASTSSQRIPEVGCKPTQVRVAALCAPRLNERTGRGAVRAGLGFLGASLPQRARPTRQRKTHPHTLGGRARLRQRQQTASLDPGNLQHDGLQQGRPGP